MIRINLLPGEYYKKAADRKKIALGVSAAVLVLLGFTGIYFSRAATLNNLTARLKETEGELQKLKPVVDRVNSINSKKNELDRKLQVIGNLMETRLFYPIFMEDLARVFPSRVWLTALSTSGLKDDFSLSMGLQARDNYAVADFLNVLEKSPLFSGIRFTGISTSTGEAAERIFSVTCGYSAGKRTGEN